MSREETVDKRIGGRVERCQTLDERGHGRHRLGLGNVTVNLEQVKHNVGCPAQDEHCGSFVVRNGCTVELISSIR